MVVVMAGARARRGKGRGLFDLFENSGWKLGTRGSLPTTVFLGFGWSAGEDDVVDGGIRFFVHEFKSFNTMKVIRE